MSEIGYIPFVFNGVSAEAQWVRDHFACEVSVLRDLPPLNGPISIALPSIDDIRDAVSHVLAADWLIAEGPAGFLWTAVLRHFGFAGGATILPYLNPRRWQDVGAAALYTRYRDRRDRVFLGSTPSARIYRKLGVHAQVGEPYGIDDRIFHPRADASDVLRRLDIPRGRILLFAGRAQPDKDLYRLVRTALKARILFSDLQIVLATHVIDHSYVNTLRQALGSDSGVHIIERPHPEDVAALYCAADVFVTAATSHFETFGRAPAEALACGTRAIAPRYDGFAEVLDQPGGTLVGVECDESGPHVHEEELLRAVYDALSAADPLPAAVVSMAAHRRFARSVTMNLLAHVLRRDVAPTTDLGDAAESLLLPQSWKAELQTLAALSDGAALHRVWNAYGPSGRSEGLALLDESSVFVDSVRRALWMAAASHASPRAIEGPCNAA